MPDDLSGLRDEFLDRFGSLGPDHGLALRSHLIERCGGRWLRRRAASRWCARAIAWLFAWGTTYAAIDMLGEPIGVVFAVGALLWFKLGMRYHRELELARRAVAMSTWGQLPLAKTVLRK